MRIKLKFVERYGIRHKGKGLTEPSGLSLSRGGKALWTVSDDTKTVFKLDLDGSIIEGECFAVDQDGLEGIALDEKGEFLYAVREGGNVLLKYSMGARKTVNCKRLSDLEGYQGVEGHFPAGAKNKGLEGITVDGDTGNLVLLKEGDPGMLFEVSPDLEKLVEFRKLTKKRGFTDNDIKAKDIDYSGISYDSERNAFWIVSDKAKRIYLYNWQKDKVLFDKALTYKLRGDKKKIKKAEGVAYDVALDRLYVVSDQEARLYVYDIR